MEGRGQPRKPPHRSLFDRLFGPTEQDLKARREKQRQYGKKYRQTPEYAEKKRLYTERHYHSNPGKKALCIARAGHATALRRIAASRAKNPSLPPQPELTPEERQACIEMRLKAKALQELMGEPYVVDHITEIADGGVETLSNLQVMSRRDHHRKTAAAWIRKASL